MTGDHHFLIHGVRWLLRFTRLRGNAYGWTYLPDAKSPRVRPKILIDSRLEGRKRLEIIFHELIHVSFPTASEDHVTEAARDITRVVWSLGYRLDETEAP
jgi:hypothetical protein